MHNISMIQAFRIWSELEQAYHGTNSYGGNIAEIYAFRLHSMHYAEDTIYDAQVNAGKSLIAICKLFSLERDCSIIIDGLSISKWSKKYKGSSFEHRAHVKVTPKNINFVLIRK